MNADKAILFVTYWNMLAPLDLPVPVPEYRFGAIAAGGTGKGLRARLKAAGLQDWRADFAFPEQKILVEVDGGQWVRNGGRHMRDTDRDKLNHAAAMGWRVFRFSPEQLKTDPDSCVKLVEEALK